MARLPGPYAFPTLRDAERLADEMLTALEAVVEALGGDPSACDVEVSQR